ncbi:hypothetical protein HNY73_005198 [Argiope bruennichi]|uniref:Uncharacterized protein n=1 Tax=Argiope bruennichi TaxID=94029 RepID=A0A8T0FKQ6_ARGBR|nr:hypothetical protein HNY73_005198 [Argiope bruennichi]
MVLQWRQSERKNRELRIDGGEIMVNAIELKTCYRQNDLKNIPMTVESGPFSIKGAQKIPDMDQVLY